MDTMNTMNTMKTMCGDIIIVVFINKIFIF